MKIENNILNNVKTPLYIFDVINLKRRALYLKNKFKGIGLCYAVKANTFVIKELDDVVDRFEICSSGEGSICDELDINKSKMVISGVNKDYKYIENLIKTNSDCIYTIESFNQFKKICELANKYNIKPKLLIRLTSGNQFGVSEDILKYIIRLHRNDINILGIQYYSGTQKNSFKKIQRELVYLEEIINDIYKNDDFVIKELEYGPGLPVSYFEGETIEEELLFDQINELIKSLRKRVNIVFEIGRSLVAECGTYITKVIDVKKNENYNYAIVDGGINHLVYFGQMMAMKMPFLEVYPKRKNEKNETIMICGSLCTVNDILIKSLNKKIKKNYFIIFKNTGAYCATEGISLFLSRDLPSIVLKYENGFKIIRDKTEIYKLNKPNY